MKNKKILIIVAIILAVLLTYYYFHSNIDPIKERDIIEYRTINCLAGCPTEFNITLNASAITSDCKDKCLKDNNATQQVPLGYENKSVLLPYLNGCLYIAGLEKRMACFKSQLIQAKSKYPYLER